LLEQQGLLVYETWIEDGSLAGCFAIIGADGWVMVNTAMPVGRQRFTLAHEYCHSLEHRNLGFVACHGQKLEHEVYADAFAAAFLMPADAVASFFARDVMTGIRIEPERIVEFCYAYGVSYRAAVFRFHNEGLFNAGVRDRLLGARPTRLAATMGYDLSDPTSPFHQVGGVCNEGMDGLPRAYRAAALRAYGEERISESKLAALLGVDADDLDDILDPQEPNEIPIV
jgi:Zn-dependent peptidase ImmA (M78 family)